MLSVTRECSPKVLEHLYQGRILHRCGVCGARPVKLHSQKIIYLKLLLHRFNVRNISASATQSNAFFLSRNYWSITKPVDPFKKLCSPEPCYTLPCILVWRYIADGDDAFFVKNPRFLNEWLVRLEKSTRQGVTPNKCVQKEQDHEIDSNFRFANRYNFVCKV